MKQEPVPVVPTVVPRFSCQGILDYCWGREELSHEVL